MRYKKTWMKEVDRFERIDNRCSAKRNDVGLRQFYEYESRGVEPDCPDPYFSRLLNGKKWWEWTLNEYADRWGTDDWPGWLCLAYDFLDDYPGYRQVLSRIRQRYNVNGDCEKFRSNLANVDLASNGVFSGVWDLFSERSEFESVSMKKYMEFKIGASQIMCGRLSSLGKMGNINRHAAAAGTGQAGVD